MANLLSPGVYVTERDLTTIIPSVGTTEGAYVGEFEWGPINEVRLLTSENRLVGTFGRPTNNNYIDFWTCANFLAYGNNLKTVRVVDDTVAKNATSGTEQILISNKQEYELNYEAIGQETGANVEVGIFAAKYPGAFGDSLKVSICASNTAFKAVMGSRANVVSDSTTIVFNANVDDSDPVRNIRVGDILTFRTNANDLEGAFEGQVVSVVDDTVVLTTAAPISANLMYVTAAWEYAYRFDDAPGTSEYAENLNALNDEMHVVVVDTNGKFSGRKNTVIEVFPFLSKAADGKRDNGGPNYYVNVLKNSSNYVYIVNHPTASDWGSQTVGNTFDVADGIITATLSGGVNGEPTMASRITGYDTFFTNKDDHEISLVLTGESDSTLVTAIKTLVEGRGDCIAFLSPPRSDVVNNNGAEALSVVEYRNGLPSSNRLVMDSAWKYQFDKYNNVYRWLPMNGDIAGLCVATDLARDPWWSPAGFNRGQIKNVVKISWNPQQGERDELYKKGINPIVSFPGEGIILYGDKTMQTKPSAFDRINVRRLFDVLEKAISRAAKYSLFEFNDQFTRAQFVALVEPYLRDVQGRRGIYDFRVVCDETNNTPEVIDRNEFVGDIYIKPARSINFIRLNFIAVRTGVSFDEIAGKF